MNSTSWDNDLVTAATAEPDSLRRRELLEAAYRYVLANGLSGMSLRPLAKEIGSSPRVLLFLFGSKEGLIRALLARARKDELGYLEELRSEKSRSGDPGLVATGRDVWSWLVAPERRALLTLWVEGYARSLLGEPGPWAEFGAGTVADWLDLLTAHQPAARRLTKDGEAERTLLLAVLRGALLDLLATGDTERVTRAIERHLGNLERPGADPQEPEDGQQDHRAGRALLTAEGVDRVSHTP